MKKVFVILLVLLLSLQLAAAAGADAQYSTAWDLYQAWMSATPDWTENPYPDYVCGVWSTDGGTNNLTIAVTKDEAGEAGKAEILELIEHDESVTFTYQGHSYAELLAARLKIEALFGQDNGMHSLGIYEMENQIFVGVDETNPHAEAFMKDLLKQYGDMVCIELSTGPINTLEDTLVDIGGEVVHRTNHLWILLLAGIMAICGGGFILLHQRKLAVQTTNGTVQTVSAPLTRAETEEAIRRCTSQPKDETLNEILKKLP